MIVSAGNVRKQPMNVIIHFDEICLKGKNQAMFVRKLANNIGRLFKDAAVKRVEGGLLVSGLREEDYPRLVLTPGIAKLAPVIECGRDLSAIKKAVSGLVFPQEFKTFRITASRSDKKYKPSSAELNKELGKFFEEKFKMKVDLKNFDLNLRVDIGKMRALLYWQTSEGIGGLPVGVTGKVMVLVSGGIDSPVAAYQMMKRGAEVELIHFQNQTAVSAEVSQKITELAEKLACFQEKISLQIFPFASCQKEVIMKIPAEWRMLVSRRLMYKLAEQAAKKSGALALVTGDSLGQVASQTLENMSVVYQASEMLKIAPLISFNKNEIMKLARQIGTLDISNRPYEDCCSLFVAKHPKTKARLAEVQKMEKNLDFSTLDKIQPISYYISMK